jgi:formate hydrogenlyase transcriptional activator
MDVMDPLENTSKEDAPNLELNYQQYARLLGVADVVSLRHEPGLLFQNLAPRLRAIIPFDFINFSLCSPHNEKMKMYLWDGGDWPADPIEVPIEDDLVGWTWQNQSVLAIDDLRLEKQFEESLRWLGKPQLRSYCVLPMNTPHEKLGALGFGSERPRAFSPREIGFLGRVADMVGLCMDNSLAEVALNLAPLVSARKLMKPFSRATTGDELFTTRDFNFLRQIAAALVPLVERVRASREGDNPGEANQVFPGFSKGVQAVGPAVNSNSPKVNAFTAQTLLESKTFDSFPAPESLQEWEQILTVYSDASRVGLGILDTELRYQAVNSALAKMNGLAPEAHLGKSVSEVLGDSAGPIESYLGSVIARGQVLLNRQFSGLLAGRSDIGHWIAHYVPIRNASGAVTQIGTVVVEITEQKKLEESFHSVSQKLRFEEKRSQVMTEMAGLLMGKWDLRQSFPRVSAYLRRLLYQEYSALSLRNEETGQLALQAVDFPLQRVADRDAEFGTSEDPLESALRETAPLILTENDLKKSNSPAAKYYLAEGLQSLCCVPLIRPKGSLGVLVLGSTRVSAFKHDDLTLLNQVAAQLAIALENDQASRQVEQLKNRLDLEKSYLNGDPESSFEGIIGESPTLQRALRRVEIVAESNATVLLLGETGTGKGLVARALHERSTRKNERFVTLNCAAIPTGLLESELFGHEKGAFTGAIQQKIGRLELAENGTLFLDEVGEIPYELQPKLLRVLQDHEFERLGGIKTIKVNLRLIAATNRDLEKSVLEREFRSDLFYRLNVFPIRLPSLRERREDIPSLVSHFVNKFAARMNRVIETIPSETMSVLVNYEWPGNVRELENFIERSVILTEGTALRAPTGQLQVEGAKLADLSLKESEREHIIRILRETRGLISGPYGAAGRLGLKRTTLQSKIERHGIMPNDYLDTPLD